MIGLCPHLGYLLAWPFNRHPWDLSGTPGIFEPWIVFFSAFLALALFSRMRWVGFTAAVFALLVATLQFQRIHFLIYRSGWLSFRALYNMLDNAMATGAFLKLIATLISALLAFTLLRVLCWETIRGKAGSFQPAPIASASVQRTKQFLVGMLLLSAVMLLLLAHITPANLGEYYGARSGFSIRFQLLALIPVVLAAAGLAVCVAVLAASAPVMYRSKNAGSAHQGKFSLGVIVSLAYFAAALDSCGPGLLRN